MASGSRKLGLVVRLRLALRDFERLPRAAGRDEEAPRLPPPLVGEALDTDQLVLTLSRESPEKYAAIRTFYIWSGTLQMRAEQLGCHVDTLTNRVRAAARYRLDDLDQARRARMLRPQKPLQGAPSSADTSHHSLTLRRIAQMPFYPVDSANFPLNLGQRL
jgi:hypothetical protein